MTVCVVLASQGQVPILRGTGAGAFVNVMTRIAAPSFDLEWLVGSLFEREHRNKCSGIDCG